MPTTQLFKAEELQERYQNLPPLVRAILDSEDIGNQVDRIAKEHDLLMDQTDVLAQEITYTILGLRRPGDFINSLESRMGIKHVMAYQIGTEIEEVVFKPIRDHLYSAENHESYEAPITTPAEPVTPVVLEDEHEGIESADDLLSEIENATDLPTLPISTALQTNSFQKMNERMNTPHVSVMPTKAEVVNKPIAPVATPQAIQQTINVPRNIPGTMEPMIPKMPSSTVPPATPKPSFIQSEVGMKTTAEPKKYITDPYREPVK